MTNPISLLDLIGQYPVLEALSGYLSTVDLVRLGLTARRAHALILGSPAVFDVLKRQCLCDGHGLRRRLADSHAGVRRHAPPPPPDRGWCGSAGRPSAEEELYRAAVRRRLPPDAAADDDNAQGLCGRRWQEAEVEARLYARRCDAARALPCRRCGVNVCEECRDYPRVLPDLGQWPNRRPHLGADGRHENLVCLCPPCDAAAERGLRGRFLSPRCDCDRYRRWVCRPCADAEAREDAAYRRDHARVAQSLDELMARVRRPTKRMPGGAEGGRRPLWLHCPCGADVPPETLFRCTWCKRRHRPEREWPAELAEAGATVPPYVDDGGCYPMYSVQRYATDTYPRLAYDGPIYRRASEADGRDTEEAGTAISSPVNQVEQARSRRTPG